jgi:hypothetical protein
MELHQEKAPDGGARRRKVATRKPKSKTVKKASTYKKTARKHTAKDGTKRTIYSKDGKEYVKRVSKKTGAVRFVKL